MLGLINNARISDDIPSPGLEILRVYIERLLFGSSVLGIGDRGSSDEDRQVPVLVEFAF